jgi:hypothetical protein
LVFELVVRATPLGIFALIKVPLEVRSTNTALGLQLYTSRFLLNAH